MRRNTFVKWLWLVKPVWRGSGISGSGRPCRRTSTAAAERGTGHAIALASASICESRGCSGVAHDGGIVDRGTVPGVEQVYDPGAGSVNWKTAPHGSFALAHSRPSWASMIERQIESPSPRPLGLVV
jgi:hypothetical protein